MERLETKYLIIGNSAGGIGAAEAIRSIDPAGPIIMVSDEPYHAYSRPLIAEHLAERRPVEAMLYRPADFYTRHRVQVILGTKVARIKNRKVELEDRIEISWQRLLLATGGSPIVLEIKGVERKGVYYFTRLADAIAIDKRLRQFTRQPARVVIIGGGLIGMSAAEAMIKRGAKVSIVEMKEHILSTILDGEASAVVAAKVRESGADILTGRTVARITSYQGNAATGVILDDGRRIPCEMVMIAIGVRPRIELAADAGIKLNRGIVVDRHMATSLPHVYACGDAAEAYDFVYGENRLTPVLPNACLGGRTAGLNMAGVSTEYPGATSMNSLKYFGLSVVSAGIVSQSGGLEEITCREGNTYRKVGLRGDRVVGMIFVDDIERSGIVYGLMKEAVDVSRFKESLVAKDFGLAFLPADIRSLWLGSYEPVPVPETVPVG